MNLSQAELAWLYLYALLLGVALAAVYDLLRITRVFLGVRYSRRFAKRMRDVQLPFLRPRPKRAESRALGVVVFFEDLFFCMFAAVALILLFYQANNGKFRFPALLAVGAGFLLYRGTLGRLVMLFSEVIAFFIETGVRYLLFFMLFPIRTLFGFVKKRLGLAAKRAQYTYRHSRRKHFTSDQIERVRRDACGMIPEKAMPKRTPKKGKYVAKRKKTIQSDAADAPASGTSGRRVNRRVRQ